MQELKHALLFLHVNELQSICSRLQIPSNGKKIILIERILHFVSTGKIIKEPEYPKTSCSKRIAKPTLHPESLILNGSYKNDLATRLFFKKLIGEHFHYTVYGLDWLHERWMEGNPPTYQEFATMWQTEHVRRKQHPGAPKEEWAYINFVQNLKQTRPSASREAVLIAWDQERARQKQRAAELLKIAL